MIRSLARRLGLVLVAGSLALPAAAQEAAPDAAPTHAIAMHGEPKYPADFTHFDYANPDAPKGGTLSQAVVGSFDSLNPFIVTGRPAAGVRDYAFAQLMARSWDEPFSLYGYVAKSVEMPADRRSITFHLDPRARFEDGTPITVDDVIFSMETLRAKGLPGFRRNYGRIASVERVGDDGVRFVFNDEAERETPLVVALMPVLSKAWYTAHPIDQPGLDVPLGSGPYRIASVDPGRRIVYERVPDWWGADLPAFRGYDNFDRLVFDYYNDAGVALEAFKAGQYNLRRETDAATWVTGYDVPAAKDGRMTLLTLPHSRPEGMRAFVFNTRRAPFDDPRVREALTYAFDFEWINRNLLQGQYKRTDSFFVNSDLAARGLPEGAELALLEPYRAQLPPELFTAEYRPPASDGSGNNRANLRTADRMLTEAGWVVQNGTRVDSQTGRPLAFEILLGSAADERIALTFAAALKRLGVTATVRTVDSAQYAERTDDFDFDMIVHRWGVTLSPGAEQNLYWGSQSADTNGTRNYAGVKDPVVDALIGRLEGATTREDLVAAARALDRVLLWGHYVIPLYYLDRDLIAYWGRMGRVTDVNPIYGTVIETWWSEE